VERFINLWKRYTDAVAREAELRERGQILDLKSFTPLRRHNSAVLLCFSLIEYTLGIDLDDEVYEDATFMDAYWAACDHVCWANVCHGLYTCIPNYYLLNTSFQNLGRLFLRYGAVKRSHRKQHRHRFDEGERNKLARNRRLHWRPLQRAR
jgi:hypothetical protein